MTSSTPITVSDLTYLPSTRLASLLKDSSIEVANTSPDSTNANQSVAVIDVRDSDHIGGHIRSSTWVPSDQLPTKLPELVRTLADKDMVVFHCALSQVRGPSAALKYARERQRLLGKESGNQEQRVCVLEGGFTMWQERYGEDASLTEGYAKDIWQDSNGGQHISSGVSAISSQILLVKASSSQPDTLPQHISRPMTPQEAPRGEKLVPT